MKLPSNATVKGDYLDRIDFSYTAPSADFSRLKLCVAENVHNDGATLKDSAGSFVGKATGTYYQHSNTQNVQGGGVFKYADAEYGTIIAMGTATAPAGLTKDIIRYEMKTTTSGTLVFSRITRAQENTGSLANEGFQPVGVWMGARSEGVYEALEQVAASLKSCVRNPQQ